MNHNKFSPAKLFDIALVLIPFTFPYSTFGLFNVVAILLIVLWLLKGDFRLRFTQLYKNKLAGLFISTYLTYVVYLLFTNDIRVGGFLLEKKIVILLFPIVLSTTEVNETQFRNILLSFVGSCFLATLFSLGCVIFCVYDPSSFWNMTEWYRVSFSDLLDLHPTYYSIYLIFSIIILFFFILKKWGSMTIFLRIGTVMLLVYFFILSLLLSSRTPLVVLFFFTIVAYYRFWLKHKLIATVCVVFSLGIVFYLFSDVPYFKNRISEIQETKWAPPVGIYHNSTNLRAGTFYCALSLLKENWLLGLGTGNVQANLNDCYKANGFSDVMYLNEYNTHNEYLNVWLNTGIAGIILFLVSLFLPLRLAIKNKNYLYITFLFLMMVVFLTENILERQKGIIFYAFFNSLLAFIPHNKNMISE